MPSAGISSVTDVGTYIFDASGLAAATSFYVRVPSDSTYGALVNVPGLHEPSDFFPVGIGCDIIFRNSNFGINKVYAKGSGGTATVVYGIVSRTYQHD